MKVTYDAGFYRISHIAGPTSALLILGLTEHATSDAPAIEWQSYSVPAGREPPDPEVVRTAVMQGMAEANRLHGRSFEATVIKYHFDGVQARAMDVFSYLAFQIVEFAAGHSDDDLFPTGGL